MCQPIYLLKNEKSECLGIKRSRNSEGSNEKVGSIDWSNCDFSTKTLQWVLLQNKEEMSGFKNVKLFHICKITEEAGKECITMSHSVPSNKVAKSAKSVILQSKPFSAKDKTQLWELKYLQLSEESIKTNSLIFVYMLANFGHQGFCLGWNNSIKSKSLADGQDRLFPQCAILNSTMR